MPDLPCAFACNPTWKLIFTPKDQMTLSLNKHKLDNLANEIWKSAERLRGKFKAYEYQNVILPIIVIRRLEYVLIKWREEKKAEIREKQPKCSLSEVFRPRAVKVRKFP